MAKAAAGGFASAIGKFVGAAFVGAVIGGIAGLVVIGGSTAALAGAGLGAFGGLGLAVLMASA